MTDGIRRGRPSMRGSSRLPTRSADVAAPASQPAIRTPGRIRVLFVCIGNSCRSQMAEGFARKYGQGAIEVFSAGLMPAPIVQEDTHRTMTERGVTLEGHQPKGIELMVRETFDVVINMSGSALPAMNARQVIDWSVRDPIGQSLGVYRSVAGQIEQLVMRLVTDLRTWVP
jgi:arsenate reductase (thioredoxin)